MPHSLSLCLFFPMQMYCSLFNTNSRTHPSAHPHFRTLTNTLTTPIQQSNKSCALGIVNHNQNNRTNEANVPHAKQQSAE